MLETGFGPNSQKDITSIDRMSATHTASGTAKKKYNTKINTITISKCTVDQVITGLCTLIQKNLVAN